MKDMEHQDWLCNIIDQHIKFHPSDAFTDISNTTHPKEDIYNPYNIHNLVKYWILIEMLH